MGDDPRDGVWIRRIRVGDEVIDANGHVNNVAYVTWIQEAATRHAEATGCADATRAAGAMWVVREHRVLYVKQAFPGDELEMRTWVATMETARSLRRTEIVRPADGATVVRAWTDWVFVDRAKDRPARIPPEVASAFVLIPEPDGSGYRRASR